MGNSTLAEEWGQESAFARPSVPGDALPTGSTEWGSAGLTKRELFAAMALQGICAGQYRGHEVDIARAAIQRADALIAELSKEPSHDR